MIWKCKQKIWEKSNVTGEMWDRLDSPPPLCFTAYMGIAVFHSWISVLPLHVQFTYRVINVNVYVWGWVGGKQHTHTSHSTYCLKNCPNSCFSQLEKHEGFKGIWSCGQFACTCKNLSVSLQLLCQDWTKGRAGHGGCSCAYRTSRPTSTSKQKKSGHTERWRIQTG